MKKAASEPKMKDFFAPEPTCIVHGAGKKCVTNTRPIFSKKAEIVFEKLSQLDATAKSAKIIHDWFGKQILKSYAKHGDKAFKGLRGFKNTEVLGGIRNLVGMPLEKHQNMLKNMWRDTKDNAKRLFK